MCDQILAMPARNQQHQVGKPQRVGQARRQGVPGQMVDPDQGQPGSGTQPLGDHDARQDSADQPRTRRHRNAVQIRQADPGTQQRAFDAMVQPFDMGPRGDFRHHTTEIGMQGGLPLHLGRQDFGTMPRHMAHHRSGRVIATAFNAQKGQFASHCRVGLSMTIAQVHLRR